MAEYCDWENWQDIYTSKKFNELFGPSKVKLDDLRYRIDDALKDIKFDQTQDVKLSKLEIEGDKIIATFEYNHV